MRTDRVGIHLLCVLAGLVAALWLYPWLDTHRYQRLTTAAATEFFVTSRANNGPGSLREALFNAIRSDAPAAIILRATEITVTTPLPPLVTRSTIRISSDGEPRVIRAAGSFETPLFDVRAGRVELEGFAIHGASSGGAVHTASPERVTLRGVTIADSGVGVRATGGFELEIDGATFDGNRIGVEALGSGTSLIRATTFRDHEEAAIWAIGTAAPLDEGALQATGNRIEGGRFGAVLGNLRASLHENEINGFRGDGIIAIGGSLDITNNRIWNGRGAAIRSSGMRSGLVQANEVHELGSMGILVQSAAAANVTDNRVYRNGYGIVTVLNDNPAAVELRRNLVLAQLADGFVVVGDSPLIAENRVIQNRAAGLRIFNLVTATSYRAASPLLVDNLFEQNGEHEPVVSDYVLRRGDE